MCHNQIKFIFCIDDSLINNKLTKNGGDLKLDYTVIIAAALSAQPLDVQARV